MEKRRITDYAFESYFSRAVIELETVENTLYEAQEDAIGDESERIDLILKDIDELKEKLLDFELYYE